MRTTELLLSLGDAASASGRAAAPSFGANRLAFGGVELPSVSPMLIGIGFGAVVGVAAFLAIVLLLTRRGGKRAALSQSQVMFVPPYATVPAGRLSPLPPQMLAFAPPPSSAPGSFVPPADPSGPVIEVLAELEVPAEDALDDSDFLDADEAPSAPAISVAPVVVVSGPARDEASSSGPHPLGIIPSSSTAMRAAPIADLSFDDSPTEIGETFFDEPPRPQARGSRPKIRPIAPTPPRFAAPAAGLPAVTPPPAKVQPPARHP